MNFENIYKEAAGEIGNGKLYVKQYNAGNSFQTYQGESGKGSRDEWVPLSKATKVSPTAKSAIVAAAKNLTPKEVKELNEFDPSPTPDIVTNGDNVQVNFPNGTKKVMDLEESKKRVATLFRETYKNDLISKCTDLIYDRYSIDELAQMEYEDAYEAVFSTLLEVIAEESENVSHTNIQYLTDKILDSFGIM